MRAEAFSHKMRIDQAAIREILARTDIGTFIGTHVQLRKRGNDLVGLCRGFSLSSIARPR